MNSRAFFLIDQVLYRLLRFSGDAHKALKNVFHVAQTECPVFNDNFASSKGNIKLILPVLAELDFEKMRLYDDLRAAATHVIVTTAGPRDRPIVEHAWHKSAISGQTDPVR